MTRTEASQMILSTPKENILLHFKNNVINVEWKEIDIIIPNGKAVVNNPEAIQLVKEVLLAQLDRELQTVVTEKS